MQLLPDRVEEAVQLHAVVVQPLHRVAVVAVGEVLEELQLAPQRVLDVALDADAAVLRAHEQLRGLADGLAVLVLLHLQVQTHLQRGLYALGDHAQDDSGVEVHLTLLLVLDAVHADLPQGHRAHLDLVDERNVVDELRLVLEEVGAHHQPAQLVYLVDYELGHEARVQVQAVLVGVAVDGVHALAEAVALGAVLLVLAHREEQSLRGGFVPVHGVLVLYEDYDSEQQLARVLVYALLLAQQVLPVGDIPGAHQEPREDQARHQVQAEVLEVVDHAQGPLEYLQDRHGEHESEG